MARYDVTEQVLETARLSGAGLDVERLTTLWRIICEENEAEAHLVTEAQWMSWTAFEAGVERALAAATCDADRIQALDPVIRALSSEVTEATREGYAGVERTGMFHARLG